MRPNRATAASVTTTALALLLAVPGRAAFHIPGFGGPPKVDVALREVPAEDLWQVRYHLPEKAAGVDLVHGRGSYRRTGWSVLPAGSQWVDAPEVERLCFPAPTRDFAVSFRTDVASRPKDYEVNVAMSDGGRLLYTGHLAVRPLERCGAGADAQPAGEPPAHRFAFTTSAGRTIRVGDRAGDGALRWEAPLGSEQTYVYFGPQPGVVGERMVLIADPALPTWVRGDLEATVARLFDRFAGETGLSLPARPLVLLAFDPHGSGRSFDGGVLGEGA
ncbi:MAG TPA: hypothetical protein VGV61_07435, partial [Thermoanaerobaculia bacterium]|nr:hypothetical protein [Thermoanaerobaculia bacterium]